MSEGQDGREDQAITSPGVDEDHGTDDVSPVMSYERGDDYLKQVISQGEPKYEGKGKAKSESFTHLPATVPSTPSTAPSTRRTSEIPDASTPSTNPSTRPNSDSPGAPGPSRAPPTGLVGKAQDDKAVSQAQADPEPSTADGTSSLTQTKHDSAGTAAHGDAGTSPDEAEPASATGQGDSTAISAQDGTPHHTVQSGSGPIDTQDEVPLGPIESQDKAATEPIESQDKAATEPTGPPNPLTTIPSAKDKPLEESGPGAAGPKATDPVTPQTPADPPQADEGAPGSQANEPQPTESKRVELGGTDQVWEPPAKTPVANPPNSPHHRADIAPKPILKKTAGTAEEARLAEEGGVRHGDVFGSDGSSEEAPDPKGGLKRFRGAVANFKANRHRENVEADVVDRLNTETEGEVGTPRLGMEPFSGGNRDGEGAEKKPKICPLRCTLL